MSEFQGKVVLVTGSSRGIGAAIAKLFARRGAKVVVHGRDLAAIARTVGEIKDAGNQAMGVAADLTRFNEIEAARQEIESVWGTVEILIANAGGTHTPPSNFEQITEEGWHASIEGNLTATFLTVKSFLPSMKARGSGIVITMSSTVGRRPSARSPVAYAAAKAGIESLSQRLAAEVGTSGIRVNCIAPETILTERNLDWIPSAQQESLAQMHPTGRLGTPEDIAQAALFLASPSSSWITGQVLEVDGGGAMT